MSADVELVGSTGRLASLPPAADVTFAAIAGRVCIGQKQRWFLLRLKRADAKFAFDSTNEPEFDQWRWVGLLGAGARGHLLQAARLHAGARPSSPRSPSPAAPVSPPAWWDEMSTTAPDPHGQAAASVE